MNRWLDRHVVIAKLVGACSVLTAIYGAVHLVRFIGVDMPFDGMSRFSLILFGLSLSVSGIAGVLITRRILERNEAERKRLEREGPSKAIWERAQENYDEQRRRPSTS